MHALIGKKVQQTQKFLTDGTRIPVTIVSTVANPVVAVKTKDTDGYWAVQLGMGIAKNPKKPQLGHAKKAQLDKAPFLLKEVRFSDKQAENMPEAGQLIKAVEVFEAGDIVDVTGFSKGKGFAGGVKRHGFHGGPKTHGQSDRWRAPGSIGSGTTPGRVYKGKRMAGKMGNETVTLKNLEVVEVGEDYLWIKGVVPGTLDGAVVVTATGKKDKNFPGVLKAEDASATSAQEAKEVASEEVVAEATPNAVEEKEEVKEETPNVPEEQTAEKKEEAK